MTHENPLPQTREGASGGGKMRFANRYVVAAVLTLAAGAAHAEAPVKIRVGWTVPAEEAKWLIMKRPELFANINKTYAIEWFQFQGTPPMSQALLAKAVDCAT